MGKRIIKIVTEAGPKESEFIGGETELIVNIYRKNITDQSEQTYILKDEENLILELISNDPKITQKTISKKLGYTLSTTKYYIGKLSQNGFLSRIGTNRKGKWVVNK